MPALRAPRDLNSDEVRTIALRARDILITRFGDDRVRNAFVQLGPIGIELVKATYIAVREKIEQELPNA